MTMAYDKQTWNNDDPSTPLSAARLGHIEDGIAGADAAATTAQSAAEAAQSAADGAATADHTHEMSDVNGLDSALAGKANASSLSGKADQSALAGKADQSALDELAARVQALEDAAGGA